MKLNNKVAVITGAGSGIGRAIAFRFAAEGARIVVAEINKESGDETARILEDSGARAFAVATNVAKSDEVANLFAEIDNRGWSVDVMVNNAGNANNGFKAVHEVSDADWDSLIDVHLNGTFYCTREAVKRMLVAKSGAIINIGSVAGMRGLPGASAYTAAKGGIIALTKGVAQEVAAQGIRVNCIAPGWTDTPILNNVPASIHKMITAMTPLGRLGLPEEIAATALFLASEESSFIIGQVISPNGGMYS
jgi:NAD(P)-dependent dehydrogenase (short-subunit alcohol dehydrogenase family)